MSATFEAAPRARVITPWLLVCLALFAALHSALAFHDVASPRHFLEGDRATKRRNKINIVLGIDGTLKDAPPPWSTLRNTLDTETARAMPIEQKLLNLGPPGDYLFHAGLYRAGGRLAVIGVQVLLALAAVFAIFRLCRRLGFGDGWAFVTTTTAMLLPSTLVQSHQLVTEGLFAPLCAIALSLLVASVEDKSHPRLFGLAVCLIAVALLVRTQLLLYPLLLAAIFLWHDPRRWRRTVVPILVICYAVPVGWALFEALQPASAHVGATELSLTRNLSGIVKRMAMAGGFAFDRGAYPGEQMPVGDFLAYVARHPLSFLYVKLTDVIELVFNPAITILGKYFGIDLFRFETADGKLFWSQLRAREGVFGVVREIMRQQPLFVASFLLAAALWGAIVLLALLGGWRLMRDRRRAPATRAILISFVLYNLAVVQASEMVRATHRSTVDFLIVLFAACGVQAIGAWLGHRRDRRSPPAAAGANREPPAPPGRGILPPLPTRWT